MQMRDVTNSLSTAVIGATATYGVYKAAEAAGEPSITLPIEKDKSFEEIHDMQKSNAASIGLTATMVCMWIFFNAVYLRGAINHSETSNVSAVMLGLVNFLAIGIWAIRKTYANNRMINAIYAYMKYATDNLEFLEFKFLREVPEPSRKALEDWNARLEEYRKKVENPAFDDKYFPDMGNLSLKEMETIYDSFTEPERENLQNYWVWLATRPEEEQHSILDQMKNKINATKVKLYDEVAFKKGRR